jgi:hypothetical protein
MAVGHKVALLPLQVVYMHFCDHYLHLNILANDLPSFKVTDGINCIKNEMVIDTSLPI